MTSKMGEAFTLTGADRTGRWVVTCDHASNAVPSEVANGDLGLPRTDMERHIAYDVGAMGVALALGEALSAPVVASTFSRLVIDPNRGEDDPTLLMQVYDGSIIPANRGATPDEIERRLELFHRPYHRTVAEVLDAREDPLIISIHSFTPQFVGRPPRPWHVGVLYAEDRRLAVPLIDRLIVEGDLCVGDNQPYSGHLPGDAMDRHGVQAGRKHVLIEVRNDLIETPGQQDVWGKRLARVLEDTLAHADL
ncbi:N-formylglutamate amidohydrolase [Gymnodinialimonas hymeniacidonis]|uniref:N-formylglutamate amidohydrolase n=1 Tax=Gymnodinialimonas hymeniacidonis TaxID=3126508 RepID=UPI0034C647EE